MQKIPLKFYQGHLFLTVNDRNWLLDTGAPNSFGEISTINVEAREFDIPPGYIGLTAARLSEYIGFPTAGIIGADILNDFDILLDIPNGQASFTEDQIRCEGDVIKTDDFMGIPVIESEINGSARRMFFDTGAQISYFQDESLKDFPTAGTVTDFFPGFGQFETETHLIEAAIGNSQYHLRCGTLPGLLGMTLMMANVEGIIGNEILQERIAGFFPRRHQIVFI